MVCNAVASELIAPREAFLAAWDDNHTDDYVQKVRNIVKLFKCGVSVIARKALDSKKIEQIVYDTIVEDAIEAYRL